MNQISQVLGRFGNIRRFDRVAVGAFGWMGIRCVAWSMTVSITMRKQTFPSPTSEMFAKKKFLNRSAKQNSAT